ncbi:kinase-(PK-like) protein [Ceratobasidium theobromae]|uniref:ubiquitinyl hydrolase 1 n=1 Tax=Ceratobasidium theobromae TaxID=1582974 RepID=A0A5N5QLA6_9AGAM|nr:kinase-(PK-like) protein [Ceratobasidium theobromae]
MTRSTGCFALVDLRRCWFTDSGQSCWARSAVLVHNLLLKKGRFTGGAGVIALTLLPPKRYTKDILQIDKPPRGGVHKYGYFFPLSTSQNMDLPSPHSDVLHHLAYHIFLPLRLPQKESSATHNQEVSLEILSSVIRAARRYQALRIDSEDAAQWNHIIPMLHHIHNDLQVPLETASLTRNIAAMKKDNIMSLHVRAQNTAVIIRKYRDKTTFEVFEVQPRTADVMSIPGKLVRNFPGPVVEVSSTIANDIEFISEISSFLVQMDTKEFSEATPTTRKAGSNVRESRDSMDPNYFIQLLFGILRGMGTMIHPPRITKRIADEVLWKNAEKPWRRSPIWLIIRVALQTSLDSRSTYKHFMVFYLADLLSRCHQHESFSSDLLHAMRAKIAIRLYKLKDSAPSQVVEVVRIAVEDTQKVLVERWKSIQTDQAQSLGEIRRPTSSETEASVRHSLINSRACLEAVFKGRTGRMPRTHFSPSHEPRLENIQAFALYATGGLSRSVSNHKHVALFDFEASVFDNLSAWTKVNLKQALDSCKAIQSCFQQYLTKAREHYSVDVADQSIMILVLMKLWVAMDELATADCPLLLHFSPEIPDNILDPLLLRTALHLEHARLVQEHIRNRHARASSSSFNSVFSDDASHRSFAVQYFRQSPKHQSLKQTIEHDAQLERDKRLHELAHKNYEYEQLGYYAQELEHTYVETPRSRKKKHPQKRCEKCKTENRRNNMIIAPHEWPLPERQCDAEVAVFELDPPVAFTIWRDMTFAVLVDLAEARNREKFTPHTTLEGYSVLSRYMSRELGVSQQIELASSTKSFNRTHYKSAIKIPASQLQVCVNNGLQLRLYDKVNGMRGASPFLEPSFAKYGTLKILPGSYYKHLNYALEDTNHTSNQVLADQYDCPKELSIHEHIAFGTLRSGPRLQWMNIARGLEENNFTFNSEEVRLLHTQAAWQIGPMTRDGSREWHEELGIPEFGKLLVVHSRRLLERVKANWLEANSVATIISLVARLLASSPPNDVAQDIYRLLREARAVAFEWLTTLQVKLQMAEVDADIMNYQVRICEMAAICRSTFDVDPTHMPRLLSTIEDFSTFLKCSIVLFDNKPPDINNSPTSLQVTLGRDCRLSHKALPNILKNINLDEKLLSMPISSVWPDLNPGANGWKVLEAPNGRWVSTTTTSKDGNISQLVHFNVLDGQLLVDGKPLGRLPRGYVQHPDYIRLFGQKILDVVPANFPGMEFTTRERIDGHQVSFTFSGKQIIIQARKDGQLFELVPHSELSKDFPEFLSVDYHHWADLTHKSLEFRSLSSPWSSSDRQWVLHFGPDGTSTVKRVGNPASLLVDIHSSLFNFFARQLSPLESPRYFHTTRSFDGKTQVELPRMKLSFFINEEGQLESHNFRGQIVDEKQSTGTMFGLINQLVLIAKDPISKLLPQARTVIIPHGDVQFTTHEHHASVTICLDSRRHIQFHQYKVDEDLGYLASDSGLTSRLFKIYLHALTSHCLPDPLTGRTGCEEALYDLSAAATSSFEQINEDQAKLLKLIGSLSPKREYYPAHLKCMQTTHWVNLPPLSQHYAFSAATATILKHADTLQLFNPLGFSVEDYIITHEDILLKRAAQRTNGYYPSESFEFTSQALGQPGTQDIVYNGRDDLIGTWEEAGQSAVWVARLAFSYWDRPFYKPYDLVKVAESWGSLEVPRSDLMLTFSPDWLDLKLSTSWIALYDLCRYAPVSGNKYGFCISLAAAAFSGKVSSDLLATFVSFASNLLFRSLDPPRYHSFKLKDGYKPTVNRIRAILLKSTHRLKDTPSGKLLKFEGETSREFEQRRIAHYDSEIAQNLSKLSQSLLNQWPSTFLHLSLPEYSPWLLTNDCLPRVKDYFASCARNIELRSHFQQVKYVLSSHPVSEGSNFVRMAHYTIDHPSSICIRGSRNPWKSLSMGNLMSDRTCQSHAGFSRLSQDPIFTKTGPAADTSRLSGLFTEFKRSSQPLDRQYGEQLDESRRDLATKATVALPGELPPADLLIENAKVCRAYLHTVFRRLVSSLSALTAIDHIVSISGLWPRVLPRTLLFHLTLKARIKLDTLPTWRRGIVEYALAFVGYQRSQRLVSLSMLGNTEEFYRELDLTTNENTVGINNLDWILIQIDGNFGARSVQHQVAKEMISPSSGSNMVLQLNMGEGKSSVIVPFIAASLANTKQLVRVIVLKPLWRQMFHLLVNRLSGLANRRIYYLPFGRHIRVDESKAQKLKDLYRECMHEGGILLAQPEHVLSFKLMGIDQLISAKTDQEIAIAHRLREMQNWLSGQARDILDESDEILHVRYQLVYTVGEQQPLEDHPDRWITTQNVLRLLATHIGRLEPNYPASLKYETKKQGQFPFIRIMLDCDDEVEQELISAISWDILGGQIPNLNCTRLPSPVRKLALKFITEKNFSYQGYQNLKQKCDSTTWKGLLLVRGLLASGIVVFALKYKHYRVDYGLDLSRSLLAVPYRAKQDIPSLRAEFGHPDVAVVLTCLSYYYKGLTEDQLDQCFELLYKLDNPTLEYEQWTQRSSTIPTDLRQLNGVNIKDREQFRNRIIPTFSRNFSVIDFFLSSVVFPKEAKEFSEKLSTSGWDLAEKKAHVATGFSGTNDNRYLLPTSIAQTDPVKQLCTNALVLTFLLQPENNHYLCMRSDDGKPLTTDKFLELLVSQEPEIRVLLDVGAQMLELQNEELVRCWLNLKPDIEAAVYFNDRDEIVVLPQRGTPSPLHSSPFAQRLDKCVVYLDDGHTRGTDLKLLRNTRALVTLGPKVTKDRLLQGCMRMRQLGHGQSVMFAAPPEIDNQIRNASPRALGVEDKVDTLDVLRWAMLETCKDLQHHVSHWAQQGVEHHRRAEAQLKYEKNRSISTLKQAWTTPESRSLEKMYGVPPPHLGVEHSSFTQQAFAIPSLRERLELLGIQRLDDPSMDEEQEREVSHEIEREQQVERPLKRQPAIHAIHSDVHHFIQTGTMQAQHSGIVSLFLPLGSSSTRSWSQELFASIDFLRTIAGTSGHYLSDFIRPVNWVVRGKGNVLLVLGPQEVNGLLPLIRQSSLVRLHVYAPRVTRSMRSFSDLQFYSVPARANPSKIFQLARTQIQFDLFAGQLYLADYEEYLLLCAILGLHALPCNQNEQIDSQVESDGFIKPENRFHIAEYYPEYAQCKFTSSPIPILRDLIGRRRKGMKYIGTHIGGILHGQALTQNDF